MSLISRCKKWLALLSALLFFPSLQAQHAVLKTNALGWATASPNIGTEIALGMNSTLDLSASFNPFVYKQGKQWKHWLVQPEYRYWLCEKYYGHFFGIHALGGEYNVGKVHLPFGLFGSLRDSRYQGWAVGGGLSYGYQYPLSLHWSIEGTVGVGYVYTEYDKYPCAECGSLLQSGHKNYVGLTKAAINLIYVF